jgi:uncharacterized integral membrane protein (TIGR02327 family)
MVFFNVESFIYLLVYLFFIGLVFWCLKDIHLERYVRMHINQYRILMIILSTSLGYNCASFFIWVINIMTNH